MGCQGSTLTRSAEPVKTHAIVLRSIRHSESSRILTLFSRDLGRIAVIAKGARRVKGGQSIGGSEPPALVEALIHLKPHRGVQTLGGLSVVDDFHRIKGELSRTATGAVVLQLIDRCFTEGETNSDAFAAALEALGHLELFTGDLRIVLWRFQLKLFSIIGFELNPFPCPVCGKAEALLDVRNQFLAGEGAVCCHSCRSEEDSQMTLSGESVSILRRLSRYSLNGFINLKASREARREISRALALYLRFHHAGVGELPALAMLDQLEAGGG